MTGAQALDLMVQRLGDRTDLRAAILLEMILAQQTLEGDVGFLPFFLTDGTGGVNLTMTVGVRTVEVPTNFLREVDEWRPLVIVDSAGEHEMYKDDYDTLREKYGTDSSDLPEAYALVGVQFIIYPIPTAAAAAKSLNLPRYIGRGALPADDTVETTWLKHAPDLLLAETGIVMASQYLENQEKASTFVGMAARARKRIADFNIARTEANMNRSMGDD